MLNWARSSLRKLSLGFRFNLICKSLDAICLPWLFTRRFRCLWIYKLSIMRLISLLKGKEPSSHWGSTRLARSIWVPSCAKLNACQIGKLVLYDCLKCTMQLWTHNAYHQLWLILSKFTIQSSVTSLRAYPAAATLLRKSFSQTSQNCKKSKTTGP